MTDTPTLHFDALRAVLEAKAHQAMLDAGLGPERIWIDGYPFVQPEDVVWAYFCYGAGKTFPAAAGQAVAAQAKERTIGFYQFDIFAPENSSNAPATQLGDKLRNSFKLKDWLVADIGHVKTESGNINPIDGAPKGFKRWVLRGAFDFWHEG